MNHDMSKPPLPPHTPEPVGKHSPGPQGARPAGMNRQALRSLKCSIPHDEFAAVRWAANRAGKSAMPLAEFFRAALREKVQTVAGQEVERGRKLPPEIARMMAGANE